MQMKGLGVTWFRKEDFPRWCEIDPNFQPDYDHWLRRMEGQLAALDAKGIAYERVLVDPDEFLAWCKRRGFVPDSTFTRSQYAAMTVAGDLDAPVRFPDQGTKQ